MSPPLIIFLAIVLIAYVFFTWAHFNHHKNKTNHFKQEFLTTIEVTVYDHEGGSCGIKPVYNSGNGPYVRMFNNKNQPQYLLSHGYLELPSMILQGSYVTWKLHRGKYEDLGFKQKLTSFTQEINYACHY